MTGPALIAWLLCLANAVASIIFGWGSTYTAIWCAAAVVIGAVGRGRP